MLASLSLDLDNHWSYLKTHGDPSWQSLPTYLDTVVPRILETCRRLHLRMTVFVVGQDAADRRNGEALARIAADGHEIANHSYHHEPWLHRYSSRQIDTEIASAEEKITAATGVRPEGFRGPGYSLSADALEVLCRRGYLYDASTFPTYIGPLARTYYLRKSLLGKKEQTERDRLFGTLRDGFRPLRPYRWAVNGSTLIEVPVTTIPGARVPMHLSYILYASTFSASLARAYLQTAFAMCQVAGVEPSLLLHPLDFLGRDDVRDLAFFPGMGLPSEVKLSRVQEYLTCFSRRFDVLPLGAYVRAVTARGRLPKRAVEGSCTHLSMKLDILRACAILRHLQE